MDNEDSIDYLTEYFAGVEQYQRDVNAEFERMDVVAGDLVWQTWCAEMDAWNEAVAAEALADDELPA